MTLERKARELLDDAGVSNAHSMLRWQLDGVIALIRDLEATQDLLSQVAAALGIQEHAGIYTVGGVRFESLAQAAREKLEQVRREK